MLLFIVVLAGIFQIAPWMSLRFWLALLLGIQGAVGLTYRDRVNAMAEAVRPASVETQVLRAGLQLLEDTEFQSAKLQGLAAEARNGSSSVRGLERLLNVLHERQKEWFYLPSLVLMIGTQMCMAIGKWRGKHAESLKGWVRAWAEFEALNALATYAYENPGNVFPEVVTGKQVFEADGMGHPLLPPDSCVANNVALNGNARFYAISGSNMSGKSTLLRAIGLNAVLACAGAPVRAKNLRLSLVSIFASISVADSLQGGKSKFLAEIDRLRGMIEAAQRGDPVLFLIDEMLSGTNSQDRRVASEAVIRTLVSRGAIGAVSTHDLALCEIAEMEGLYGTNVHMGSPPGGGPLDFDYQLKPGVTRESNALAIARMAGVPA
jgi:DNA mismatch repair ATPase MutS